MLGSSCGSAEELLQEEPCHTKQSPIPKVRYNQVRYHRYLVWVYLQQFFFDNYVIHHDNIHGQLYNVPKYTSYRISNILVQCPLIRIPNISSHVNQNNEDFTVPCEHLNKLLYNTSWRDTVQSTQHSTYCKSADETTYLGATLSTYFVTGQNYSST